MEKWKWYHTYYWIGEKVFRLSKFASIYKDRSFIKILIFLSIWKVLCDRIINLQHLPSNMFQLIKSIILYVYNNRTEDWIIVLCPNLICLSNLIIHSNRKLNIKLVCIPISEIYCKINLSLLFYYLYPCKWVHFHFLWVKVNTKYPCISV